MSEYIGSKISLISKRDIRYQGTLHSINSENHTVALESVRSFGTEGRRNGVDEVEPQSEVYDYIVFRGSDVKELSIEEATPEKPPVPQDPAIIDSKRPSQPPAGAPLGPPGPPGPPAGYPGYPPYPHGHAPYPPMGPPKSIPPDAPYLMGAYPPPMGYPPYPPYPPNPSMGHPPLPPLSRENTPASGRPGSQPHRPGKPVELGASGSPGPASGISHPSQRPSESNPDENAPVGDRASQAASDRASAAATSVPVDSRPTELSTQTQNRVPGPGRGGMARGNRGQTESADGSNSNWEKTNAQFQELALSERPVNAADPAPEYKSVPEEVTSEVKAPPAYDKGKSFFDNISSDLRDREDGRDRQFRDNERRKNLETFGQGSVDHTNSYRYRGHTGFHRGRGRGGSNPNYRGRGNRGRVHGSVA